MGACTELYNKISDIIQKRQQDKHGGKPRITGTQVFFRGEPECFPLLSSSLYRYILRDDYWLAGDESYKTKDGHVKESYLFRCEGRILNFATMFGNYQDIFSKHDNIKGAEDFSEKQRQLLGEVQIRGGKTNFIDFTRNLDVALFFACYSPHTKDSSSWFKDGRLIIYYYENKSSSPSYEPLYPKTTYSHLQNNVLIRPKNNGAIDIDKEKDWFDVVIISPSEKEAIQRDLSNLFNINITAIYNGDLQGYIRNEGLFI